jgi:two-component system, NarL family, nitrate/nitrite response regulator NarL
MIADHHSVAAPGPWRARNAYWVVPMPTLIIVSDIRLYREGLAELLSRRDSLHVIGTATHPDEALQQACELDPAVVVIDQALPGSLLLTRTLAQVRPDIRVVALGVPDSESLLVFAEAGVAGYVPREGSVEDLVEAVQCATRGELQCSPQLAGTLIRRLAWRAAVGSNVTASPLTARESEIVRLIDEGLSNKEIAVRLGIEVATVKNHVHNLLEKLRVHRRGEAAAQLRGRDPGHALPRRVR